MVSTSRLQFPNVFQITDGSTTWRYQIARNTKGKRIWRRTSVAVQPGQGELVKTWESWHTGMGWSRDETRNSEYAAPVYEVGSASPTHRGYLYPPLAISTISQTTSGLAFTITSMERVTEKGGYIYFFGTSGTDILVFKVTPPGTIKYGRVFSGWTAPAGQTTEFGDYLYVPSAGGLFKELTTIAGDLTAAWYYDGTNYTNNTAAAIASGGTPYTVLADHTDDIFYFGAATKFDGVFFDIGTAAGSTLTMDWEFWNGSSWTDILGPETDGTTGLTVDGWVTWASASQTGWAAATPTATSMGGTPPDDTSRYWVRVKTSTATPWTAPTCAWNPISDVWTDGPTDRRAWHMGTAGKLLWRAGDASTPAKTYVINSCSAISSGGSGGPLASASWSTADYVIGKPGRAIKSFAELGRWLYPGKEDGLFGSDADGNQTNALDFVRNLMGSYNCVDSIRWLGTLVTMGSNGRSLWQHTGASSRPIGIETLESNLSAIRGGRYIGFACAGQWLYVLYRVSSTNYLLAARPGHDDEPAVVWHSMFAFNTVSNGMHISTLNTNPTLYVAGVLTNTFAAYITLAADGSPDPTDSAASFYTSPANFDLPAVDWGMPGTLKRGHMVEIVTKQVGTGGSASVSYGWDGATPSTNLGSAVAGLKRLFWTAGTTDSGYRPQLRIVQTGAATGCLRVEKVSLYCVGLPRKEPAIICTLEMADLMDGARTREDMYDELDALVTAGVYTLYDPDDPEGTATFKVIIDNIEESKGEQIERQSGKSYVDVTMRVVKYT